MKWSHYFIPTLKETPASAVIASHQLMIRSGMIRKMNAGLYCYLPYGLKILKNIENIIREEMDRSGAIEITMPLLISRKSLDRSGRWEVFQNELYRLKDRSNSDMALSPTNEENFTELIKNEMSSYRQFPINLYQINDKFRDEIRPRYGAMRAKEFIMKDAYSFHLTDESLDEGYQKMKTAYNNIFTRSGLDFVSVEADSGAMGGSGSEEFMVKSQIGEETLLFCNCGYVANQETADEKITLPSVSMLGEEKVEEVFTPDQNTIQRVCSFLKKDISHSVKTRVFETVSMIDQRIQPLVVVIRGDYEVNEVKLNNLFPNDKVRLASEKTIEEIFHCPAGYLGVRGLSPQVRLVVDVTLRGIKDGVMGANKEGYHLTGIGEKELFGERPAIYENIYMAKSGGICKRCEKRLDFFKGIEVGHIFKLGPNYAKAFNIEIINELNKKVIPTMGCYGIGVNRLLAAIIEQSHDERGIILPYSVAPFKIVIISLNIDQEKVFQKSEKFYRLFQDKGWSPLWDDRDERAGAKFSDADLIGVPFQVVVGEKGIKNDQFELRIRAGGKEGENLKKIVSEKDLVHQIMVGMESI